MYTYEGVLKRFWLYSLPKSDKITKHQNLFHEGLLVWAGNFSFIIKKLQQNYLNE